MTHKIHVPHPSDAKSDAEHLAFAKQMMEQIDLGHYKVSDVRVHRTDSGDSSNRTHKRHFSMNFVVEDVNPSDLPKEVATAA